MSASFSPWKCVAAITISEHKGAAPSVLSQMTFSSQIKPEFVRYGDLGRVKIATVWPRAPLTVPKTVARLKELVKSP